MDPHRIEVLNGADDHDVVCQVAHHLQLILLPAQQRLLDQDFMNRRCIQPARNDFLKLFAVERDSPAGASQCETRANDRGKPDLDQEFPCLHQIPGYTRPRRNEAYLGHGLFEQLTVLRYLHGAKLRSDHLHTVMIQHAGPRKFHR